MESQRQSYLLIACDQNGVANLAVVANSLEVGPADVRPV